MINKKDKFEFEKLEIPRTQSIEPHSEKTKEYEYSSKPSNLILRLSGFVAFGLLLLFIYYYNQKQSITEIPSTKPSNKSTADTIYLPANKQEDKPIYFNYYDSVVFLNNHTDNKVVIAKGFDEYIKKNKLIIKSGKHYYNCFCDDLYEVYKPGDVIP